MELIELVWKVRDWKAVEAIISQSNNKIVLPTTLPGWIRVYKDVYGDDKLGILARMVVLPNTTVSGWIKVWHDTPYDASLKVRTVIVNKIISLDPTYDECMELLDAFPENVFYHADFPDLSGLWTIVFQVAAKKAKGYEQNKQIFIYSTEGSRLQKETFSQIVEAKPSINQWFDLYQYPSIREYQGKILDVVFTLKPSWKVMLKFGKENDPEDKITKWFYEQNDLTFSEWIGVSDVLGRRQFNQKLEETAKTFDQLKELIDRSCDEKEREERVFRKMIVKAKSFTEKQQIWFKCYILHRRIADTKTIARQCFDDMKKLGTFDEWYDVIAHDRDILRFHRQYGSAIKHLFTLTPSEDQLVVICKQCDRIPKIKNWALNELASRATDVSYWQFIARYAKNGSALWKRAVKNIAQSVQGT